MIVIENSKFILKVNENCKAESLVLKSNGEECLEKDTEVSLFSLTEERPFNNEIKLAYPSKRTTFEANSLRREGNRLIAGFEVLPFEAVVEIKETDDYISFTFVECIGELEKYRDGLKMDYPPVAEFRLLQLPVKNREKFGEWLNVSHDDKAAVAILGVSPHADVDSQRRKGYRVMYADAKRGIKLYGCEAALVVARPDSLLDCIEKLECDYDLPRGVESRRYPELNRSVYWTMDINPENADEHIAYAKKGGFKRMYIYYSAMTYSGAYWALGDYHKYRDTYPNGEEDVKNLLKKIKDAGFTVGIHFLHTHIGVKSQYIAPVADHRLNLVKHFTLAKDVSCDDDKIYVEQNPEGTTECDDCKMLRFDGEIIHYESYTKEYPYCFCGCKRGHFGTNVTEHKLGTIGGLLDVSEYCAESIYIDQETSLQDEVAENIAKIYNLGFDIAYFDGSEGTNTPYAYHIPNAQYRVYKKFDKKPIYSEGAAKGHFSWHMLSGGNGFDPFPMNVFKEKIAEFPLEEAPRIADDFTRVNFGWWDFNKDTQPDMYEYGTSKAASWDCPVTVMAFMTKLKENARIDDIFEVLRRWEDVRKKNLLTKEQKEMLRDADTEYTLLINEKGEYELVPYYEIEVSEHNKDICAFSFERNGKSYAVCWHKTDRGNLTLDVAKENIICEKELGGEKIAVSGDDEHSVITVSGKCYISSNLPMEEFRKVF